MLSVVKTPLTFSAPLTLCAAAHCLGGFFALGSLFNQQGAGKAQGEKDKSSGFGSIFSGIAGIAKLFSDIRLKRNIVKLGTENGINIYKWEWNDTAQAMGINDPTIGVIAQEHPEFTTEVNGYLAVDYGRLFSGQ